MAAEREKWGSTGREAELRLRGETGSPSPLISFFLALLMAPPRWFRSKMADGKNATARSREREPPPPSVSSRAFPPRVQSRRQVARAALFSRHARAMWPWRFQLSFPYPSLLRRSSTLKICIVDVGKSENCSPLIFFKKVATVEKHESSRR